MSRINSSHRSLVIITALISGIFPFLFLIQVFADSRAVEELTSELQLETWQPIFTDTFDVDFPGIWTVTDTNGLEHGEYFWLSTPITSSHGSSSLWPAGGGKDGQDLIPGSDPYPNNSTAIMVAGPITVGHYQDLRLSLDVWIDTEPVSDTLQLSISSDGDAFTAFKILSGTLDHWQTKEIALDDRVDSSQLWIMLSFYSDESTTGEGVFIDNLRLEAKDEDQLPLLFPVIRRGKQPTPEPGPGWLSYINQFRVASKLEPVTENGEWSEGGRLHSRYMVLNDYVGHYENPENQWYAAAGATAAKSGNVFVTSWLDSPDENAIDFWMVAPFHAVSILDPQLKETGFGSYREDIGHWNMAATLDVLRGRGALPEGTSFPILYPPEGGQTQLDRYYGGEFPNPLSSCPNYEAPTGPPIIVQLGPGDITPVVLSHSLESDGQILESCLYDETTYINANSGHQSSGRIILNNRDAVVIMPRYPLASGNNYSVKVTTIDDTISWTFQTANSPEKLSNIGLFDQVIK